MKSVAVIRIPNSEGKSIAQSSQVGSLLCGSLQETALSVASRPSLCLSSVSCLRFTRNWRATETSNFVETWR